MTEHPKDRKEKLPRAVFSDGPSKELEEQLKRNPHDTGTKVDVGSDESMDASDPPSTSQPGSDREPAPSSSFPDEKDR